MTAEHLTFRQIEDYVAKRLPPEQIPSFHEHAASCEPCRQLLVSMTVTEHIGEQLAVDYAAGLLSADERQQVADHLQTCATCAAMVADLNEFRESEELLPGPPALPQRGWQTPVWATLLAATLLLALGASLWVALRFNHQDPVVTARLRDAGGLLELDRHGVLRSTAAIPAGATDLIATALRTGTLPAGPGDLRTEPGQTLRTTTPSVDSAPQMLYPDRIRVLSDQPEFRWAALDGVESYEVAVFDENFNEVARSGPLHATTWTPQTPLPRQRQLVWEVAVVRHGTRTTASAPPAGFPLFEIIAAEASRRIAAANFLRPPSHLLLAILYSEAGLRKEAVAELDALETLNPGSALPSSLRGSVLQQP